jgi:hypothetical protein
MRKNLLGVVVTFGGPDRDTLSFLGCFFPPHRTEAICYPIRIEEDFTYLYIYIFNLPSPPLPNILNLLSLSFLVENFWQYLTYSFISDALIYSWCFLIPHSVTRSESFSALHVLLISTAVLSFFP